MVLLQVSTGKKDLQQEKYQDHSFEPDEFLFPAAQL
jgi:hypothetical protein